MKQIKYILALIISMLLFVLPAALFVVYAISKNAIWLIAAGVILIITIITYNPLTEWRAHARVLSQTDEFGNSKRKSYEKLSQKERDMIDLQKTADAERIVGSATLRKLTHAGSENPQRDMDTLIGLNNVKQKIVEMAAKMEFEQQEKKKKGKKYRSPFESGHHAVYFGAPGTGKAQPMYSQVLTPTGFVAMGSIKPGDTVYDGEGNVTTVLGVFPQGNKPIYEIEFINGNTVRCSDEHLWNVQNRTDRITGHYQTITLTQLMNDIKHEPYRISVDSVNPISHVHTKCMIKQITYIGKEECQCIYVQSPFHTYITDNYIVTHNTTIARIMTGYLYKYGYIKENKVVEVDGNFLKAGSETSAKTTMVIQKAFGGVLFIDEAYSLIYGDSFGLDAIATLIKQMEDNRDRFVLILAGYTNEMRQLLEANPGFESRIKEYLFFEDYNDIEMEQIFTGMARSLGYSVDSLGLVNFRKRIEAERPLKSFGNARTARSVLDEAIEKHAYNFISQRLPDSQRYTLTANDISVTPRTI